jgi:hypothetical protein
VNNEPFSRQTRLREVGAKGQALIAACHVELGSDAASCVAAEYLTRSGVGSVEQKISHTIDPFTHAGYFTYPVTEQFAHGAWLATQAIVALLDLRSQGPSGPK